MNEEYLWNKSGNDPEIERLEKALAVFRHRENAMPPFLPVAEVTKPAPRWRFPLAFAFAACAAVVFAGIAWQQITLTSDEGNMMTYVSLPQVEEAVPAAPIETAPPAQPAKPTAPAPRRAKDKIQNTVARSVDRPKKIHRDNLAPKGIASLTKEELHAYEQLMLALSITSSKLKIVQDTINGTDDTAPSKHNER